MNKKERDILKMKNYKYGCRVKIPSLNLSCAYRNFELQRVIQHEIIHWHWIGKAPKTNKVRYYEVHDDSTQSSTTQIGIDSSVSVETSTGTAPDHAEETAKTLHESVFAAFPETPQKSPIVKNDVNLRDTVFDSPL